MPKDLVGTGAVPEQRPSLALRAESIGKWQSDMPTAPTPGKDAAASSSNPRASPASTKEEGREGRGGNEQTFKEARAMTGTWLSHPVRGGRSRKTNLKLKELALPYRRWHPSNRGSKRQGDPDNYTRR